MFQLIPGFLFSLYVQSKNEKKRRDISEISKKDGYEKVDTSMTMYLSQP